MTETVTFDVNQALGQVERLATTYGPQAVDLAARVIHYNAVGKFIFFVVIAVIAFILLSGCTVLSICFTRSDATHHARTVAYYDSDRKGPAPSHEKCWESMWGLPVVSGCLATIFTLWSIVLACDVWMWVALFDDPRLALAHDVWARITTCST